MLKSVVSKSSSVVGFLLGVLAVACVGETGEGADAVLGATEGSTSSGDPGDEGSEVANTGGNGVGLAPHTGGVPGSVGALVGNTGGSLSTGGSTGGTTGATGGTGASPVDECDRTEDCLATYGAGAIDCVDSQSDESWCDCGGQACSEGSDPPVDPPIDPPIDPPGSGACPTTGALPPASDWRFFDIRGPGEDSNYYETQGAIEIFRTDDPSGDGAIERSERASYFWTGSSGWNEFCANYDSKRGGGSVFQIKIRDEPVPVLMIARTSDGIRIAHGNTVKGMNLATDAQFSLRVRNNGTQTEVFVDGVLWVTFDDNRSGLHFFKYGLYHGKNAYGELDEGSLLEVTDLWLTINDPIRNP